jgi:putative serine protease PepD
MTDEDQPSKDEQVSWAPPASPPTGPPASPPPAPGPGASRDEETTESAGSGDPVVTSAAKESSRPGGSTTPMPQNENQNENPAPARPGRPVSAPTWPAYPPPSAPSQPGPQADAASGSSSEPNQALPHHRAGQPAQFGQPRFGQPSGQDESAPGQSPQAGSHQPFQGQPGYQPPAYPAYPQSQYQNPGSQQQPPIFRSPQPPQPPSGWSSPSGPPASSWSADLGDTHSQPNPQNPNPQNPALNPTWGAPPPLPPGRATGRASGRRTFMAAMIGAAVLAGVLGGFGGSALYDNVNESNGRNPTVTLPDPVTDNRDVTAGQVTSVAAAVTPSVVSIEVTAGSAQGTGSGFVIDADHGYILTNNHVVTAESDTKASSIRVVFQDGTQAKGTVVGADASYDLAVVKVKAKGLRELAFGDSDQARVGDPVVAIGAPLGLQGTVTTGIVSALNRPVAAGGGNTPAFINAIQTDAAINPGNSGGPLVNAAGHVIAVNSAIARVPDTTGSTTSGSIGLGFAIPSNQAKRTAQELIRTGKASHPIIGVTLDSTYSGEGVLVSRTAQNGQPAVTAGGPADRAGIKPGDVITQFNQRPVTSPDELIVAIRAQSPGDTVTLTIRRGGKSEQDVKVKLDASSN